MCQTNIISKYGQYCGFPVCFIVFLRDLSSICQWRGVLYSTHALLVIFNIGMFNYSCHFYISLFRLSGRYTDGMVCVRIPSFNPLKTKRVCFI
jgi:hypothetical protein